MSMKLTPAAATSTTTWPGPATGSGHSPGTIASGPPGSLTTIARIASRPFALVATSSLSRPLAGRTRRVSGTPGESASRRRGRRAPRRLGTSGVRPLVWVLDDGGGAGDGPGGGTLGRSHVGILHDRGGAVGRRGGADGGPGVRRVAGDEFLPDRLQVGDLACRRAGAA